MKGTVEPAWLTHQMADQLGVSGLFVVGGALVSVPLLERWCRRKRELDEAVTAIGSNAPTFRRTR
jgi:hypothetical protein